MFLFDDVIMEDTNLIFTAAQAAGRPLSLALLKPGWTANNNTRRPAGKAVDDGGRTFASIFSSSASAFLAVDLRGQVTVESVLVRVNGRECQIWYMMLKLTHDAMAA